MNYAYGTRLKCVKEDTPERRVEEVEEYEVIGSEERVLGTVLHLWRLDPVTGRRLSMTRVGDLRGPSPGTGRVRWEYVCPKCGTASQIWENQLTGKLTCHRAGCHIEIP